MYLTVRCVSKTLFVIGGFLCYMMADGCTYSVGIIYEEFLNVFEDSKAATAALPGLIYALPQIFGPIICPFVDAIGSAYSAFIGSLLLLLSFFVSRFASSLQLMYVTMGFISSIGLELTYVSAIMAVTKGFVDQKYMGLALGITVSGSGIGVFIFNPLVLHLIETYTWKGALVVESAIFLHIFLAGSLFKLAYTISFFKSFRKRKKPDIRIVMPADSSNGVNEEKKLKQPEKPVDTENNKDFDPVVRTNISANALANDEKRSSVILSRTQTKNCEPFINPISHHTRSSSFDRRYAANYNNVVEGCNGNNSSNITNKEQQNKEEVTANNKSNNSNSNSNSNTNANGPPEMLVSLPVDEHSAAYVRRLSLFQSQTIKQSAKSSNESIHTIEKTHSYATTVVNETNIIDPDVAALTSKHQNQKLTIWSKFWMDLKNSISSMFDRKLWINPELLLYLLITFLFAMSVVVPWTFSYDHSISNGIEPTAASLMVSMIGIGSCFGQIAFGALSDYIPAIILYTGGCLVAGAIVLALRWAVHYILLMLLHFTFGVSQGVCYALFSVILVHYVGVDLYSASLGLMLLLSGSGNLIGTTTAGHINDKTGNYELAYIISGTVLIFCAILALPLCRFWSKNKQHTSN